MLFVKMRELLCVGFMFYAFTLYSFLVYISVCHYPNAITRTVVLPLLDITKLLSLIRFDNWSLVFINVRVLL